MKQSDNRSYRDALLFVKETHMMKASTSAQYVCRAARAANEYRIGTVESLAHVHQTSIFDKP